MPRAKVFAALRQVVGAGEFELPAATVGELLKGAEARFGEAFARLIPNCTVLVNGTGIKLPEGLDTPIGESDEIAILPPVGGGR